MSAPRFLRILQALALALIPHAALAVTIPTVPASMSTCGLLTGFSCVGGGAVGFSAYIEVVIIGAIQAIFLAAAAAFFFYYSIRLILESNDESIVEETKNAYGYAVGGAAVVTLAGLLVQAVGQNAPGTLVNTAPVLTGLESVTDYFRLMVSAVLSAMIMYQGVKLILSQGDESAMEEQKKKFFYSLIGVAVVLLADVGVDAFFPGDGTGIINTQIVGIINFLLTIFGALSILAVIIAGIMLVVSTNEELKDRAKKTIFTAVISLIIVLCSYLIVNFVASL